MERWHWLCACSLGSSWLRPISYLCSWGKNYSIQAGRKDWLATSDCTSSASGPSSSEVSQLEYRTSLQLPLRTLGWIWSWLAVAFPVVRPSSPWMLFSSQTSPTTRPPYTFCAPLRQESRGQPSSPYWEQNQTNQAKNI